jgi:serine/threonine protein kinase
LIGTSVSHYLLLERLATGARGGAVYKARDTELDRLVAVKLLPAGASARAHEHGIVHRGLKPSEVLVTPDGQARIIDFGTAALDDRT